MSLHARLSPVEKEIYRGFLQRSGRARADAWAKERLGLPHEKAKGSTVEKSIDRVLEHQRAARAAGDERLRRAHYEAPVGRAATEAAAALIGPEWKEALGRAYPLILLLVRSALEGGHQAKTENTTLYHAFSTLPVLGALCAAVEGRNKPYCEKTIRRWLARGAKHAAPLRCWLGWTVWTTDTLLEYRRGVDPKTGQPYLTGKSRGPVIGGTVLRVYLDPLTPEQLERSAAGGVRPLAEALRHSWRCLESDRHQGLTTASKGLPVSQAELNVRVNEERTKDLVKCGLVFRDRSKSPRQKTNVLAQEYVYPDIGTLEGAKRLVDDVNRAARTLMQAIEGRDTNAKGESLEGRYRHALWVAVKADRYGDDRTGFELLRLGVRLAEELKREQHTLKDPGAYVWSLLEARGFKELRRDYSYQPGRFLRVFSRGMARAMGIRA